MKKEQLLKFVEDNPFPDLGSLPTEAKEEVLADYFDSFCWNIVQLDVNEVIALKDDYGDFDFDDEFADALEDKVGYDLDEIRFMIEKLQDYEAKEEAKEVFTNDAVTLEFEDDNWKEFPERTGSEAMMRLVKTLPNGKLYSDLKNNLVFIQNDSEALNGGGFVGRR